MLTKKQIIAALVSVLALVLAATTAQARGSVQRGADLTFDCIECHGMDGKGDFETPPIAGLKESYILKQLRAFYSGKKKTTDNIMHIYTEDRTDQDLQDLAAYWASRSK